MHILQYALIELNVGAGSTRITGLPWKSYIVSATTGATVMSHQNIALPIFVYHLQQNW
jgi:hypothetical protein